MKAFVTLWPLALWLWPDSPMAPYSCFKNFGKLTRYYIFRSFLHIKLQLSIKLQCVGHGTGMNMMFLVPYYFYVSYQESHTKGGHKVKKNTEKRSLFKTPVFGAVINEAHARSPSKIKQIQKSGFSESRAINCIYWWINSNTLCFFNQQKKFTDCIDQNLC